MTRRGAFIGALRAAVVLALSLLDPELLGTEWLASQIRESSSSPVIDTPIVNAFSAPVHAVTVADPVGGNRAIASLSAEVARLLLHKKRALRLHGDTVSIDGLRVPCPAGSDRHPEAARSRCARGSSSPSGGRSDG